MTLQKEIGLNLLGSDALSSLGIKIKKIELSVGRIRNTPQFLYQFLDILLDYIPAEVKEIGSETIRAPSRIGCIMIHTYQTRNLSINRQGKTAKSLNWIEKKLANTKN